MLSDNIRNYRKKNNLSQDELAEKVGVSRQSISFWENGQTQPTIDNIIALAKIFDISSDMLLGNTDNINTLQNEAPQKQKSNKPFLVLILIIIITLIIGVAVLCIYLLNNGSSKENLNSKNDSTVVELDNSSVNVSKTTSNSKPANTETSKPIANKPHQPSTDTVPDNSDAVESNITSSEPKADPPSTDTEEFDLFTYCKNFAIQKGSLNGDYCIYQQPASKYGGYEGEYVSISYWADSDMVEFCLHCPLDETLSHNFYIRMRGGYNKKYEYMSSKYYRDNGESLRSASGYIDPAVFSKNYPISCDKYTGSLDGQDQFMEDTRVGICDLIDCLKKFVTVEGMECNFSAFDFVNF